MAAQLRRAIAQRARRNVAQVINGSRSDLNDKSALRLNGYCTSDRFVLGRAAARSTSV
jgi:hypothetical protein